LWRRQQPGWDVRRLVFIDETGLNTKMARHHGRCSAGRRCVSAIPHGHWQSSTLIAALRQESIAAPFLIEGPVDAEVFTVYLERVLCPQLREGDILILDNLSTHKIQNVARLLSARGASVRYLPPYSPDLNPIEQAFAKLKAHLRQAAARTLEDLHAALAAALNSFSPQHCQGFFRHAQYASI
jgi:transposase